MAALKIHGYHDAGFGTQPMKPIFDLDELHDAVRLRSSVEIMGSRVYPYRIEKEDGSGRSWNLYCYDGKQVHVYALRRG